jgi:hypothetical protein
MSAYLILLGVIAVLALLNIVLIYRSRASQAQHAAAIQKTVSDALQTATDHRQRLDTELAKTQEKHRDETIIERAHVADRRDFNNDWGGLPIELSGNNAASDSAATASQAGSAGDQG